MKTRNQNPYASPTFAYGEVPTLRRFRDLWAHRPLANRALVIALASLIGAWAAVVALLTAELWFRRVGFSVKSADSAYNVIGWLAETLVVAGAIACVTSFVSGTWIHRVSVALLLVPYAPLMRNILPNLWHKLTHL